MLMDEIGVTKVKKWLSRLHPRVMIGWRFWGYVDLPVNIFFARVEWVKKIIRQLLVASIG